MSTIKKTFLLIVFFISININSFGIGGAECYCFQIEVKTVTTNYTGHVRINTYNNINVDSISNDGYFTNYIFSEKNSHNDTLFINSFSFLINYKDSYSKTINYTPYRDKNYDTQILFENIVSISFIKEGKCYDGISVVNILKPEDEVWCVTRPIKIENIGFDVCAYQISVFEENQAIDELLIKLKKSTTNLNDWTSFYEVIKKLNGYKVIVIESCSC